MTKLSKVKKISVVISGMPSVGKTTAARALAERFRLKLIAGGDMLKQMAVERGYSPSGADWWDGRDGMEFLSERERNPEFDKEVDRRLAACLKKGGFVVTSYPIPWLSCDGIKLWFHAPPRIRARRLAGRDGISIATALDIIKRRDSENRKLYYKLYKIRFGEDLTPFHFIVDTEKLSAEEVASVTCKLVSEYRRNR
jgi:cytidylate kinase